MRQSGARANATIQSLRQQLGEASSQASSTAVSPDLARLQSEVGKLTKELRDREDGCKDLELQLQVKQQEVDGLEERICSSDAMASDYIQGFLYALITPHWKVLRS